MSEMLVHVGTQKHTMLGTYQDHSMLGTYMDRPSRYPPVIHIAVMACHGACRGTHEEHVCNICHHRSGTSDQSYSWPTTEQQTP